MNSNKINKISTLLSFCAASGCIGMMIGGFISESVSKKYTQKDQILNSVRTEIVDTKTFVSNGITVTNSKKIPARIVPDSLLLNMRP